MQGTVALSKLSVRSIAVAAAAVLALGAGGSGYWFLTSGSSRPSQVKVIPLRPATATSHAAIERGDAEAEQNAGSDLGAAIIRHAQQERADAAQGSP